MPSTKKPCPGCGHLIQPRSRSCGGCARRFGNDGGNTAYAAARSLGLRLPPNHDHVTWDRVLDLAVAEFWRKKAEMLRSQAAA